MRRDLLGLMIPLALAAAVLAPAEAVSQQLQDAGGDGGACTYACSCNEAACTCSRNGGKGGSCRTDGEVCAVFRCVGSIVPEGGALAYAADGSLVVMRGNGDVASEPVAVKAVRWSPVTPGHLVGLSCGDFVVSEFFDPEAAEISRERLRLLSL